MPIPQVNEKTIKKSDLMAEYESLGWRKILEFNWVQVINRQPHLVRYRYNADTMMCDLRECHPHQLSYVRLESTGVIWTCGSCQKSDGPIASELGERIGRPQPISEAEAWRMIGMTGQYPPIGLAEPPRGRKFQIVS